MTHLANASKISKFLEKTIVAGLNDLYSHLLQGQLGRYESLLSELLQSAFNYISELVLPEIALQLQPALVDQGRELGGRKLELRPLKICLSSGQEVEVQSPYVRQLPKDKPWSGFAPYVGSALACGGQGQSGDCTAKWAIVRL